MNKQQRENAAADRAARMARRLNLYGCAACGRSLVSVDVDKGVTPFMMHCACGQWMYSSMYRVSEDVQVLPADIEWYAPSPEQIARLIPSMRDHVKNGGLCFRAVSPRAAYLRREEQMQEVP